MASIRFGIALWPQQTAWQPFLAAARLVDRLGYDTLWAWDHLLSDTGTPDQPVFEGWLTLGAWATATEQVRLGLLVGANTFRNPGLVAKMAITLDHASGGRAILGLGGAWFTLEHEAYGIDFGKSPGERLRWLDESAGIIRALLDGRTVTHDGPRYHTHELTLYPPPVQAHLPIMVGGGGERKTLRTVAKYADLWNLGRRRSPEEVAHKDTVLREHCATAGRDPGAIERTLGTEVLIRDTPEEARQVYEAALTRNHTDPASKNPLLGSPAAIAEGLRPYVALGFRHFIVDLPSPYDQETLERLIGEVKPLVVAMSQNAMPEISDPTVQEPALTRPAPGLQ